MSTFALVGLLTALMLPAMDQPEPLPSTPPSVPPSAPPSTPGVRAEHLYAPAAGPVMVEATANRDFGRFKLSLMDAEGGEIVPAIEIRPGRLDLLAVFPDLTRLRRAAYLQLLDGDKPLGVPMVVQPLLSRLVPITAEGRTPSGARFTQIVDWRDELHPAPPAGDGAGDAESTEDAVVEETVEPERTNESLWLAEPGADDRLLSGFRLYPEQDILMQTSVGLMRIALRPDCAPNTAWNFLSLCKDGFYRNTTFHRVVALNPRGEPFVVQGGDPTGTGGGGPGYWLPMEPSDLPHEFGVLSMARDDAPDSAGCQFFICLSREGTAHLDGSYCSFGYVVQGKTTIFSIEEVELADLGTHRPVNPPRIRAVEAVPAPSRTPGSGRPDARVNRERAEEAPAPVRIER